MPVLRLDRLLQLPERRPGLYSMLLLLKGESHTQVAMLVDRVSEILHVPNNEVLPVAGEDSFNSCVEATVNMRGHVVHVLSPARFYLKGNMNRCPRSRPLNGCVSPIGSRV